MLYKLKCTISWIDGEEVYSQELLVFKHHKKIQNITFTPGSRR